MSEVCVFTGCRVKLADKRVAVVGDLFIVSSKVVLRGIPEGLWAMVQNPLESSPGPCDILALRYSEIGSYKSGDTLYYAIEVEELGLTPQALKRIGPQDIGAIIDAPILRVI